MCWYLINTQYWPLNKFGYLKAKKRYKNISTSSYIIHYLNWILLRKYRNTHLLEQPHYYILDHLNAYFLEGAVRFFTCTYSQRNHGKDGKELLAHCWHVLILWSQLNAFALQRLRSLASKSWIWSTDWVVFALQTPGLHAPVNTGVTRKC